MNGSYIWDCARWRAPFALLLALALAGPLRAVAPVVDPDVRPIALTGLPAAGVPGATYSSIYSGTAALNDLGQAVFMAQLTGPGVTSLNDWGLWVGNSPASQSLLARVGNQPIGLPAGVTYSDTFEPPHINNRGDVTFNVSIVPAVQPVESGIWTTAGGSERLLAADRYPLPNFAGNPSVNRGVWDSTLNDASQSAFYAPLADKGSYWVDTPGQSLRRAISYGDALPGDFSPHLLFINHALLANNGRLAIQAYASSTSSSGNYYGLWSETSGTMTLIARQGGVPVGSVGTITDVYNDTLSSNGLLAFDARITISGSIAAMYAQRTDGTVRLVAKTDSSVSGTSITNFYEPRINTLGRVAFPADIAGFASNPRPNSLWYEDASGLHMLTSAGQTAPGTNGAVFNGFDNVQFNDSGDLMFEAVLTHGIGGVTDANDAGTWLRLRNGQIKLIARNGDYLDVDPGPAVDLRHILQVDALGPLGRLTQERRILNSFGQVLYTAYFDDGSYGLFVTQAIPEPSTLALALAIPLVAVRRRRIISGR